MQDIVNFLCPHLPDEEARREEEFYRKKKIPNPKANLMVNGNGTSHENHVPFNGNNVTANNIFNGNGLSTIDSSLPHSNRHHPYNSSHRNTVKTEEEKYSRDVSSYHRADDQLNIAIESYPGCKLDPIKRKYIRCSIHTTITHIRKFVAKKLYKNFDQYKEVRFVLYSSCVLHKL
jgi:polycomb group RING finger protein 3